MPSELWPNSLLQSEILRQFIEGREVNLAEVRLAVALALAAYNESTSRIEELETALREAYEKVGAAKVESPYIRRPPISLPSRPKLERRPGVPHLRGSIA